MCRNCLNRVRPFVYDGLDCQKVELPILQIIRNERNLRNERNSGQDSRSKGSGAEMFIQQVFQLKSLQNGDLLRNNGQNSYKCDGRIGVSRFTFPRTCPKQVVFGEVLANPQKFFSKLCGTMFLDVVWHLDAASLPLRLLKGQLATSL